MDTWGWLVAVSGALIVLLMVCIPVGYGVFYIRVHSRTRHAGRMWVLDTFVGEVYALGLGSFFVAQLAIGSGDGVKVAAYLLGALLLLLFPIVRVKAEKEKRRLRVL